MKILCRPRQDAEKVKEDLESLSNWITISIIDPTKSRIFYADNTLTLWFDDAEQEDCEIILFNEYMAQKIKDFVDNNKDKNIFIHCTMGKCRSCAIGEVLAEYLGMDYFDFKQVNPQSQPNILVKKIMRDVFLEN